MSLKRKPMVTVNSEYPGDDYGPYIINLDGMFYKEIEDKKEADAFAKILETMLLKEWNDLEPERRAFLEALDDQPYNTITRSVFSDWLEEHGYDDEAKQDREWCKEKYDSEMWLREFANKAFLKFEDVIKAGHDFNDTHGDEYLTQQGRDDARNIMYGGDNKKLYWSHWKTYTGVDEVYKESSPFSCSC